MTGDDRRQGRLAGKVALISGTGGGQGRAAALVFAKEGATVFGCDLDAAGSEETVGLVEAAGGRMSSMHVDLTEPGAAARWVDEGAERHGGFDILYNNASLTKMTSIEAPDAWEAWQFTIRYELDLVFATILAAWPHLVARGGGSIVNISSGAAERGSAIGDGGNPGSSAAHSAAKAGVLGLTRQLAAEGAQHRIRINAILPGFTEARVTAPALADPESRARLNALNPLGRIGQGEDIAYAALYLASDEASWVTAETLVVDGGNQTILGTAAE